MGNHRSVTQEVTRSRRFHGLMYGLYYPGVLGTGIVVTLQRAPAHSSPIFVALTAGAFFSLSFASALGREDEYNVSAFLLDVIEVLGMFLCFAFLNFIEAPALVHPSLFGAYVVLIGIVPLQLLWRRAMGLTVLGYLDLKLALVLCLVVGAAFGNGPEWVHPVVAISFAVLAGFYVSHHPYTGHVRRWFCRKP